MTSKPNPTLVSFATKAWVHSISHSLPAASHPETADGIQRALLAARSREADNLNANSYVVAAAFVRPGGNSGYGSNLNQRTAGVCPWYLFLT